MEENKHSGAWMGVSFMCAALFFLLIAFVGYLVHLNAWWLVPGIPLWIGNGLLLRYANTRW